MMKNNFECRRILVDNIKNSREKLIIRKKNLFNYDLHWHDCFEIELILEGTASQILNGESFTLVPGDIYLLNPTDFHSVKSNGAVVYNIMFSEGLLDDDFLQKILSVDRNMLFHLSKSEFRSAAALIYQMLSEFENSTAYSDSYIKNLLECLFIIILRKCSFSFNENKDEKAYGIRKALLFVHSRFRENPTMAQAAETAGFNRNYFSTLFHTVTGKTYKEYINDLKLEHAKKLVLSSSIPITEVCFASGFNSLTNFLRAYRTKYGTSPGSMRKEHLTKLQAHENRA